MKIHHISDSHGFHNEYTIEKDSVVIFSGDESNYRNILYNQKEFNSFIQWFGNLPNKYKIMIAGNHSSYIAKAPTFARQQMNDLDIIYLENEEIEIEGYVIYGTPYTPTFGEWSFMKDRSKMYKVWDKVPKDVNILITHGPPKGILDLTLNRFNQYEQVGDTAILKYIPKWTDLHLMCFGHIHDFKTIKNQGLFKKDNIIYSNAAGVEDGRFDKGLINNGTLIEI